MKSPDGFDPSTVRPLLIFWEALGPAETPHDHLFRVEVAGDEFLELWVFSVSGYLRSLWRKGVKRIDLEMPDAAFRLRSLNCLFTV